MSGHPVAKDTAQRPFRQRPRGAAASGRLPPFETRDRARRQTKSPAESSREVAVAREPGSECNGRQTAPASGQVLERDCQSELAEIPMNRHAGRGVSLMLPE